MTMDIDRSSPCNDLSESLRGGNVVPLIGAGVSMQVARMPSWSQSVHCAIDHALAMRLISASDADNIRTLANDNLIGAAKRCMHVLGAPGGEYPAWLQKTFGARPTSECSPALLQAIWNLGCKLVATTNYDRLISELSPDRPEAIPWTDGARSAHALREGGAVIHLHGVYTHPESVIFGAESYEDLARNETYSAVLRALWMTKTLLFVGCSFDGLRDPDIGRLLDWAHCTFGPTPHRHYALMWEGGADVERSREFLLKWRVQIIPYGPDHTDLAPTIRRLNPNLEAANERRFVLARNIIEHCDGSPQQLRDVIFGFTKNEDQELQKIERAADAFLQTKSALASRRRGDLIAIQEYVSETLDVDALSSQINLWRSGAIKNYQGEFRALVQSAMPALELFPKPLLHALKRRGVNVHGQWLNEYCIQVYRDLEDPQYGGPSFWTRDRYSLENMVRILTSLHAVLDADPEELFPQPPAIPEIDIARNTPHLIVARKNCVELRDANAPSSIIASLPLEPKLGFGDVEAATFRGSSVITVWNDESLLIWDPRRGGDSIEHFDVDVAYGINGVAHALEEEKLMTVVTTTSGPVYRLCDMKLERNWSPLPHEFITSPVRMPGNMLFALSGNGFPILRLDIDTRQITAVLDIADIINLLRAEASIAELVESILKEDRDYIAEEFRKVGSPFHVGWENLSLQHPYLAKIVVSGREALLLYCNIRFYTQTASVIFLLRFEETAFHRLGSLFLPSCIISKLSTFVASDRTTHLAFASLSDGDEPTERVGVSRITPMTRSYLISKPRMFLPASKDFIAVTFFDETLGFAADDDGGLYRLNGMDGSFEEIDRATHADAHIRLVAPITWR